LCRRGLSCEVSVRPRYLAADRLLRAPIKIIGGKTSASSDSTRKRICEMIPDMLPNYAETFLGSGCILIGKEQVDDERVNDINPYVINFYRCLKRDRGRLWKWMQQYLNCMSAEKFNAIRMDAPDFSTENGYAAAGWYYVISRMARNAIVRFRKDGICNSTFCGQVNGRGLLDEEWYELIYERVRDVKFYNKDYVRFLAEDIKKPEDTFVVLDPPYIDVFTSYMGIKFSREDQFELAKILRHAKFYWLLTINEHPLVRKWYRPFNFHQNPVLWSCSNTAKGRGIRQELIITNY
jgi:DNA adenine methylase